MEFQITEDFGTAAGLNPEQITAIQTEVNGFYSTQIADLKKQWDGKAHENAQGILSGAATPVEKATGIKRNEGEKLGDYFNRVGSEYLGTKQTEIDALKSDYESKLKEFEGGDALKSELNKTRADLDSALQKYADYDTLKETAEKYNPLAEKYSKLEHEVCFGSVRPNFPDTVNKYEAEAKYNAWKQSVEKDWEVRFEDGTAIAVNKENKYKIEDLKSLLEKDNDILELLKGRQQTGIGSKQVELSKIEGVPFDVPLEAKTDSSIRAKAINEYLQKQNIPHHSSEYAQKMKEYNLIIMRQTA